MEDEVRMKGLGVSVAQELFLPQFLQKQLTFCQAGTGRLRCFLSPDTRIQPTFPYQGCICSVKLSCLTNPPLCCCTILSVLHILGPTLFSSSDVWKCADVLSPSAPRCQRRQIFQVPVLAIWALLGTGKRVP